MTVPPQNPQRAGWFDDPDTPDQLRYFDGVIWTSHVTPRLTTSTWRAPEAQEPATASVAERSAAPTPPGVRPPTTRPGDQPTWQHRAGAPSGHPAGRPAGPTTADGQPLATYRRRVAAFLLDGVVKAVLNVILGGWAAFFAFRTQIEAAVKDAEAGRSPNFGPGLIEQADQRWLAVYVLITALIGLVYSVAFLTTKGATPGKMATGLSVRLASRPGHIDVLTACRRYLIPFVCNVAGVLTAISTLMSMFWAFDHVMPAFDQNKQALHDKLAGTQVVVTRR